MKRPNGYWNQLTIMNEFYTLKKKLGRVPTTDDFQREGLGSLTTMIGKGRYAPGIKTYNQFLEDIGENPNHNIGRWNNPENIRKGFYEVREQLGRAPTVKEFSRKYSGAFGAITHGRYASGIHSWNEFLASLGENINCERNRWSNPENIRKAFYELKEKLGRMPFCKEFNGGAMDAIIDGRYAPSIRTWRGFLRSIKEEVDLGDEVEILDAFYAKKKELGRNPMVKEVPEIASALARGKYGPQIKTWNGFLVDIGEKIIHSMNKWNREAIKAAFYDLKKKLGRSPTSEEIPGGLIGALVKGKYDLNIRTWNAFLEDIGEKIIRNNARNKISISLLEEIAGGTE